MNIHFKSDYFDLYVRIRLILAIKVKTIIYFFCLKIGVYSEISHLLMVNGEF